VKRELEAARSARASAAESARVVYEARRRAVAVLESDGLPAARSAETLAAESYAAGQIPLAEWIAVRRESAEVLRDHLERGLELAFATVELALATGALR
jgi:hypothetical protein